jgi:hypothetical protein
VGRWDDLFADHPVLVARPQAQQQSPTGRLAIIEVKLARNAEAGGRSSPVASNLKCRSVARVGRIDRSAG